MRAGRYLPTEDLVLRARSGTVIEFHHQTNGVSMVNWAALRHRRVHPASFKGEGGLLRGAPAQIGHPRPEPLPKQAILVRHAVMGSTAAFLFESPLSKAFILRPRRSMTF